VHGGADTGEDSANSEDFAPRHVYVRPPEGPIQRLFPEGGGLIRPVPAEDVGGEWGWWYAYLTPYELTLLGEEGVEWKPLDSIPDGVAPIATGGPMASECDDTAEAGEFCGYVTPIRCARTITEEIQEAPEEYPPVGGEAYVEVVELGASAEGLPLMALRIGELWDEGEGSIPQLVLFSAQHAREWVTSEFAMRLLRYYAGSYRDGINGVRDLLKDVAILIVPVTNPDGYEYALSGSAERIWRPSREPCMGGIGTDINRNHEFSWGEPGSWPSCSTSNGSQFRGDAGDSAPETKALEVALSNDGLSGQYVSQFSLNAHSYGNVLMFPEGLSSSFSPCTTNSNCTAADLGAFHDLVGTELSPLMTDEESDLPYVTSSIFRSLYQVSGDTSTEHVYGTLGLGFAPNHMGAAIELTHTECTFYAEQIPDDEMDVLFGRFEDFVTKLLVDVPALNDGSFFDEYQLPHLHRRSPEGAGGLAEYPTLRVSRRGIGPVDFLAEGTSAQDDVLVGVAYEMWRFRPENPYVFPSTIPVCGEGLPCREVDLGDPGDLVQLCDSSRFGGGAAGWKFHGNDPGGPQDECFWEFDAASGSSPWQLTSSSWDLSDMTEARLVYSFRWSEDAATARVSVSNNGFVGCSETGYGTCRIVRSYPYGSSNVEARDMQYRTEILDISDFDGEGDVQVRFEVLTVNTGESSPWFQVYDPVIVGWRP